MIPSVGRIVHIRLSDACASSINNEKFNDATKHSNSVRGGDVFPMIICKVWGDSELASVNGQIFIDGNFTYWATSVTQGTENGQWFSPTGE